MERGGAVRSDIIVISHKALSARSGNVDLALVTISSKRGPAIPNLLRPAVDLWYLR